MEVDKKFETTVDKYEVVDEDGDLIKVVEKPATMGTVVRGSKR